MRIFAGLQRHPQLADSLLAALVAAFTLLESTQPDRQYRHPAVMVPTALLVTAPLALRRRRPVTVLLFTATVSTLSSLVVTTPSSAGTFVAILIATYTVFVRCPRRVGLQTVPVLILGATVTSLRDPATHGFIEALPTYAILAAVVMVAEVVRRSRERAERLRELTDELASSRAEAEQFAVAAERLRIARDMHDVLAHGISVMTLQVGAARIALHEAAPEVRELLGGVEDLGREALGELRDILGLLRGSDTHPVDLPAVPPADLHRLLATMRSAGLPLDVEGLDQVDDLALPVALAVFRVAQEALTNILKHAGKPPTSVRFSRSNDRFVVEVADRGVARRGRPQVPGGGHGLVGLRERLGELGGQLTSGPIPGQTGWVVRAELPLEAGLRPTVAASA
jgi:signal transduction histidine kinase